MAEFAPGTRADIYRRGIALVSPAGFGTGPILPLLPIGLRSVLYRFVPRPWVLEPVIEALVTESDSDTLARDTIAASLEHVDLERDMPASTAAVLEHFTAPVALFIGEDDPFFPPDVIVPRARERLLSLARVETLPGEKHILSEAMRTQVTGHIRGFFHESVHH